MPNDNQPPSDPPVRSSELVSRSRYKTLTCKQCGKQLVAMKREFCGPGCREEYKYLHGKINYYESVRSHCSIHQANCDYYG
jgi:hypothetical protein